MKPDGGLPLLPVDVLEKYNLIIFYSRELRV
jgi:hypothetical protein